MLIPKSGTRTRKRSQIWDVIKDKQEVPERGDGWDVQSEIWDASKQEVRDMGCG